MNLYHLYVFSFKDGNDDGIGDLWGIKEKINYLKILPVDAIYFSPVYETGFVDWGYDVKNYKKIEPTIGNNELMKEIVDELHASGKKVIFDLILNHVSKEHECFQKALLGDKKCKEFFIWRKKINNWKNYMEESAWTYVPEIGEYYLHMFHPAQPDLNYRNPEVVNYIIDTISFIVEEFGVDGFRLDVINLLLKRMDFSDVDEKCNKSHCFAKLPETVDLVKQIFDEVKSKTGKNLYLIGEVSTRSLEEWKKWSSILDSYFEFRFNQQDDKTNEFTAGYFYKILKDYIKDDYNGLIPTMPLGNHDTDRIATKFGEWNKIEPNFAQAVFNTMAILGPWNYSLYYGSELAMTNPRLPVKYKSKDQLLNVPSKKGGRDVGRTPMSWTPEQYAGFSRVEPWIPLSSNYMSNNVQTLQIGTYNILTYTHTLMEIKRKYGFPIKSSINISSDALFLRFVWKELLVSVAISFSSQEMVLTVKGKENLIWRWMGKHSLLLDGNFDIEKEH